jgi:ABC-type lipoprotein release transport system permease subunit
VFGVRAFDPLVLGSVLVVAVVMTLLATYLAARRALTIEPVEAMRAL